MQICVCMHLASVHVHSRYGKDWQKYNEDQSSPQMEMLSFSFLSCHDLAL